MSDNKVNSISDDILDELSSDMSEATERLRADGSQFNRRVYIRTFFAFLEGFAYEVRRATFDLIHFNALKYDRLNIDRLILLCEEYPTLDNTGKIKLKSQQLPFLPHFAFTLRSFADEQGFKADFFADNGWSDLQKAVKIRHRVTHPKKPSDIHISKDDLYSCAGAVDWFQNKVMARMQENRQKIKANNK